MKITERELDEKVLIKLNRLDNIVDNFDPNNLEGFLAYNSQKGFYNKKVNENILREVYKNSDFGTIRDHLKKESSNIKNTYNSNLELYKNNKVTQGFINLAKDASLNKISSNIFKVFHNNIILHKNGFINDTVNAIEKINNTLHVKILISDIVDINYLDGAFLISTKYNGIFKILNNDVELFSPLCNYKIESIAEVLFLVSPFDIMILDKDGNKIEKINTIKNDIEIPKFIVNDGNKIFVITNHNKLYCWEKDKAQLNVNNISGNFTEFSNDNRYQTLGVDIKDNILFLYGSYLMTKTFIWKLDLSDPLADYKELILDYSLKDVLILKDNVYLLAIEGHILLLSDNNVTINILFNNKMKFINSSSKVLLLFDNSLYELLIPEIEKDNKNLDFIITEKLSNNVDVLIKNYNNENIGFYDFNKNSQILPYFIAKDENDILIKLKNINSEKIIMRIVLNNNSNIEGLVVRDNKIFVK